MSGPQRTRLSRRAFLVSAGAVTVGVGIGAGYGLSRPDIPLTGRVFNAYLSLLPDGRVQAICPAQDMGQNAPLALTMILAEEMGADLARVEVIPAPRAPGLYGNPDFMHRMVTADSKTTRGYWAPLRLAGAEARRALVETACRKRGWAAADCRAEGHLVVHGPSGAEVSFEEIAAWGRLQMPGASEADLKPAGEFTLIGTSPEPGDLLDKVTGRKRYGVDRRAEDALVAVLARSAHLGGTVTAHDDSAALAVPGVEAVLPLEDRSALAVVARDTWAALQGRAALRVEWSAPGDFDSGAERARLSAALDDETAPWVGLRDTGTAGTAPTLAATFHAPALKHVIMEPLNAAARGTDMGLGVEITGSTQSPDLDMRFAAPMWKTAPFMVKVTGHPSGGAYGRRVLNDAAREAAEIAKALGRPVQVIRPMTDELRRGQVRPAAAQRVAATLSPDGTLAAWSHDLASDGTLATQLPSSLKGANGDEDNTATDGAYHPYRVAADRIRWRYVPSEPTPGFLRGVSAGYTVWAVETTVERLARRAGRDPLDWRRAHIDDARLLAAMDRVADMAGWGDTDRHLGLGVMAFRGSCVATVAEVAEGRVTGLWVAADVGQVIHPDTVLAQIEGGAIWGLSMALTEELPYAQGAAQADSLADYPILPLSDIPPIRIALMDPAPGAAPCGVGEIGVPTTIPAVANAFEAATGTAFDRLPLAV